VAGRKSKYLSNKVLNLAGAGTLTAPVTFYLALFTTLPAADDSGGVEASGAGYARLAITANTTNFPVTSTQSLTNGATFTMATATGDWSAAANIVGWGFFDASTSGNLWYSGPVTVPAPVLNTQTATIASSALTITEG
jgi:hypothetical protein